VKKLLDCRELGRSVKLIRKEKENAEEAPNGGGLGEEKRTGRIGVLDNSEFYPVAVTKA